MTEDELRKITVGEPAVVNSTITLVDYDPEWPALFQREADRSRAALGDRVLRIEHVGSTSVAGLAAKPIIDIVLVVTDTANEEAYVPALEALGYTLRIREPNFHEHRMFKSPDANINLHCYSNGCPEAWEHASQIQVTVTDKDGGSDTKTFSARDFEGQGFVNLP